MEISCPAGCVADVSVGFLAPSCNVATPFGVRPLEALPGLRFRFSAVREAVRSLAVSVRIVFGFFRVSVPFASFSAL